MTNDIFDYIHKTMGSVENPKSCRRISLRSVAEDKELGGISVELNELR